MSISLPQFLLVGGIILVALVLLAAGIIAALRARNPSATPHQAVNSDKPAPEWLKGLADTAGKTVMRAPGISGASAEAVVIMRDPAAGQWVVEINGMRYTTLKEMHDDRAASKVLEALGALQEFAGIKPTATASPLTAPPPTQSAPAPQNLALPGMEPSVATILQNKPTASQPIHPAPPNSILDQIEKVLQRNLLRHPQLSSRKIHVGAARDGSLLIEIEHETYSAVGDVPEPEIRDVIQSSIQEWERSA